MKKFLLKAIAGTVVLLAVVFVAINFLVPPQYDKAYHKALMRQHDNLVRMQGERKIIVAGSSSLAFGFNQYLMEDLSGLRCQSVGNTVGTGLRYPMEVSLGMAEEGDILVVEFRNQYFDDMGAETILTAAEDRVGMYKYFNKEDTLVVLKAYPKYISGKMNYFINRPYHAEGPYSASAFDENGFMKYDRKSGPLSRDGYSTDFGTATWVTNFDLPFIDYMNDYAARGQAKGVTVLLTYRPTLDESVASTDEEIAAFEAELEEALDFPIVSKNATYIFPIELMYDGIYHCNNEGADLRTELLYEDIKPYL